MIEAQAREQLKGVTLRRIPPAEIARGIAGTPMNEFVLWTGGAYGSKTGSRTAQILGLVNEPWAPIAMRELILRSARIGGDEGFCPDDVRDAVRRHQRARGCCYLWVRGSVHAGFVLMADVPYPCSDCGPWVQGRQVAGPAQVHVPA